MEGNGLLRCLRGWHGICKQGPHSTVRLLPEGIGASGGREHLVFEDLQLPLACRLDPRGSAAVGEKRAATNRHARAFRPALGSQSWHAASSLALAFYRYILCVTDSSCASISPSAAQSSRSSGRVCLGVHLPGVSRSRIETGRSAFLLADRPRCTLQGMTWSWAIVTVSRVCLVPRLRAATGFYALQCSATCHACLGWCSFLSPCSEPSEPNWNFWGGKPIYAKCSHMARRYGSTS
jgi:hypothetical protein